MKNNITEATDVNDAIIRDVQKALHNLKYGTILITVHGAKVVQIEVTEKRRYDGVRPYEKGGGI